MSGGQDSNWLGADEQGPGVGRRSRRIAMTNSYEKKQVDPCGVSVAV